MFQVEVTDRKRVLYFVSRNNTFCTMSKAEFILDLHKKDEIRPNVLKQNPSRVRFHRNKFNCFDEEACGRTLHTPDSFHAYLVTNER